MSAQEVGEIAPSVSNVNTRRTVEGRQARGKGMFSTYILSINVGLFI